MPNLRASANPHVSIGERADVDPAMIARYFGGKAHLYLDVIRSLPDHAPANLLERERVAYLISDSGERGISPVYHTVSQPFSDPELQTAATAELHKRLVAPLRDRLEQQGSPNADLLAQTLTAAFVGIMQARSSDVLPAVRDATVADLSALIGQLFHSAAAPAPATPPASTG